jgi:mannosyltransferase
MPRPELEFDDVIFHLQRNRGASLYWQELGRAVAAQRPDWWIVRRPGSRRTRLAPVRTTARVFHSSLFRVGVGRGVANVVTIHDLAYEKGLVGGRRARVGLAQRQLAVRAADGFVFISATTRREFAACYPAAVDRPSVVAWHGRDVSWDLDGGRVIDVPEGFERRSYVLHVGHRDGYKNFDIALGGYAGSGRCADGMPFVVLGPAPTPQERAAVTRRGLDALVRWHDAPTREALHAFVAGAYALVYVSREEGFGMPIVEAMQCGVPVVAADASCLPEIAGDAALLVDVDDPSAVSAALDRLADDTEWARWSAAGRRRATAFTWDASAAAHVDLYERLGAGRPVSTEESA